MHERVVAFTLRAHWWSKQSSMHKWWFYILCAFFLSRRNFDQFNRSCSNQSVQNCITCSWSSHSAAVRCRSSHSAAVQVQKQPLCSCAEGVYQKPWVLLTAPWGDLLVEVSGSAADVSVGHVFIWCGVALDVRSS